MNLRLSDQMMRVFVLHCFESTLSSGKQRPDGFSRPRLWQSVVESAHSAHVTAVLDVAKRNGRTHVCEPHHTVIPVDGGTGSAAFVALVVEWLTLAFEQSWADEDIVVLLEDDYAVRGPWEDAIRDGLQFGDYVTLYDHPDKYSPMYDGTPSQVFVGRVCHWRTTPSTTNSFASRWGTLRADLKQHLAFSTPESPAVRDHARWLHLWKQGRTLVSSLPAFWSHEEAGMQSPLFSHQY